jgi:queuine tRNA-ribosyltransferase
MELAVFPNGLASLRPHSSAEAMHSSIGPWLEAQQIYIAQSRLAERLESSAGGPLVLYDVGLGLGANAIAAIECFMASRFPRDLHLISFESELAGICAALGELEAFPFLGRHEQALRTLLDGGTWEATHPSGAQLRWDLQVGDFRETAPSCPPAEVTFYDFYSPKTSPELWGADALALAARSPDAFLCTYCASTPARVAMLEAGFRIGQGVSTEAKRETTVASRRVSELSAPLGREWLERKLGSSPLVNALAL